MDIQQGGYAVENNIQGMSAFMKDQTYKTDQQGQAKKKKHGAECRQPLARAFPEQKPENQPKDQGNYECNAEPDAQEGSCIHHRGGRAGQVGGTGSLKLPALSRMRHLESQFHYLPASTPGGEKCFPF